MLDEEASGVVEVRLDVFKREAKAVKVSRGTRIEDVLRSIGINPVEVVVLRGGEIIVEDEVVTEDLKLELLSVVSGG